MLNDLTMNKENYSMQDVINMLGKASEISVSNEAKLNMVIEASGRQQERLDALSVSVEKVNKVVTEVKNELKDVKMNSELSSAQRKTMRNAVGRRVRELLGLPIGVAKKDMDENQRTTFALYSDAFYGACWSEVKRMGHISHPYEITPKKFYDDGLRDIEAWYPELGIDGLKAKAEQNRADKLRADRVALARVNNRHG